MEHHRKDPAPTEALSASGFWRLAYCQSGTRMARQTDDAAEGAFWREFAPSYDEKSPLAACATELIADLKQLIPTRCHLLEIGAGPGAFTRKLAEHVSRLSIVEPSSAMRAEFEQLWDSQLLPEIHPCKWEDAEVGQADVVFGANAFYRLPDISSALLKMNATAMQRVALVQTVGRPHAGPLQVEHDGMVHERERADAICDVLAELDIPASRIDYDITRPDGPSRASLIHWAL